MIPVHELDGKNNLKIKGGYSERNHRVDCQIISGQSGQG